MDLIPRNFFTNDFFDDFMSLKENKMKCDIYEKDNMYHIEVDIPGFNKEKIKIEVNNDFLIITAEKQNEINNDNENKNYIHRERTYGKYQRTFYLKNLDSNNINASFENGVLKIIVPKINEEENKRYIEIN